MESHQVLIGTVALLLGGSVLVASLINYEKFFRLSKVQLLENLFGRRGARFTCGAAGCGLILLSGLIFAGWLPRKSQASERSQPAKPAVLPELAT